MRVKRLKGAALVTGAAAVAAGLRPGKKALRTGAVRIAAAAAAAAGIAKGGNPLAALAAEAAEKTAAAAAAATAVAAAADDGTHPRTRALLSALNNPRPRAKDTAVAAVSAVAAAKPASLRLSAIISDAVGMGGRSTAPAPAGLAQAPASRPVSGRADSPGADSSSSGRLSTGVLLVAPKPWWHGAGLDPGPLAARHAAFCSYEPEACCVVLAQVGGAVLDWGGLRACAWYVAVLHGGEVTCVQPARQGHACVHACVQPARQGHACVHACVQPARQGHACVAAQPGHGGMPRAGACRA
jgi:hypothetical protein